MRAEDGHRIGAEPEEGGVPERHQPGEAEQQVEAHGEDREDEDLRRPARADSRRRRTAAPAAPAARASPAARVCGVLGAAVVATAGAIADVGILDAEQALRPHQQHQPIMAR